MVICSILFGQIKVAEFKKVTEIGKVAPMGKVHIKIEKDESENEYTFTYVDVKFTAIDTYKSFSFKDIDNAYDNLYQIMVDGLANPPKEAILLELPNAFIWLDFVKTMGVSNVRIGHSVLKTDVTGYSVWLTKKKLDKLFGK